MFARTLALSIRLTARRPWLWLIFAANAATAMTGSGWGVAGMAITAACVLIEAAIVASGIKSHA